MAELIIERLDPSVPMPKYAREGDSGMDLAVNIRPGQAPFIINGHQTVQCELGIRAKIPEGYEIQIRPRSGKTRDGLVAQFGTIDCGYRGWWKVNLLNTSQYGQWLKHGDKIAQAVLVPATQANIVEGVVSTDTERGEEGFGSTGR